MSARRAFIRGGSLLLLTSLLHLSCSRTGADARDADGRPGDLDSIGRSDAWRFSDGPSPDGPAPDGPSPHQDGPSPQVDGPKPALDGPFPDAAEAGPPPDSALADSTSPQDAAAPGWPGYSLLSFEAAWATPNTLIWTWNCSGTIPAFDAYSFCYSPDPAAIQSGTAPCLTADDDFALGTLECDDEPMFTALYGLAPQTTLSARLEVRDTQGTTLRSAIVTQTTAAATTQQRVLFSDTLPPGAWLISLSVDDQYPFSGTHGLHSPDPASTHNLQIGGLDLTDLVLSDEEFSGALLEFYLDAPHSAPLCIYLTSPQETVEYCPKIGYLPVDGRPGYQRIQIPLSQLMVRVVSAPMTPAILNRTTKFMIGSPAWGEGEAWLDEIRIRY